MPTKLSNKLAMVTEQVREAYRNGASLRQIGDLHSVSAGTVRNALIELGEPLRSRGRRRKAELHDPRILSDELETTEGVQPSGDYEGGSF